MNHDKKPTMTRREKLISLLRQIPAAKDEELHDGRRMVADQRIEETFADKIEALYADKREEK
jgi:hypothetical protein